MGMAQWVDATQLCLIALSRVLGNFLAITTGIRNDYIFRFTCGFTVIELPTAERFNRPAMQRYSWPFVKGLNFNQFTPSLGTSSLRSFAESCS